MKIKVLENLAVGSLVGLAVLVISGNAFSMVKDGLVSGAINKQSALEKVSLENKVKGNSRQFIIKFKSEGPHALKKSANYLLKNNKKFKSETVDRSDSLDRLNQMYGVSSVRRLYFTKDFVDIAQSREIQNLIVKKIKTKFVKRNKRAIKSEIPDLTSTYVFKVPEHVDMGDVIVSYAADPHVEYVQPDYLMETQDAPNDPYYSSSGSWGQNSDDLWGLKKIQTESSWNISQGEGIVVAVVDTGVDYIHPDIKDNIWINFAEVSNNGIDDDQNGFVDDVNGYDFANQDSNPADGNGHGTHIAGTIAAVGNNRLGIIGVSPKAKIMPVKALSDEGSGYLSDLEEGLVYAAVNGADVINNSWGCTSRCPFVKSTEDAVRFAHQLGAVVVFAAGNNNDFVESYSPSNIREVISVAAFDLADHKASFSNHGNFIDVAAPGVDILSLNANSGQNHISLANPLLVVNTDYLRLSGTSMAASHVSGVAALILAHNLNLTNEDVKQILRQTADDVDAVGFDVNSGYGRVNANQALTFDASHLLKVKISEPLGNSMVFGKDLVIKGTVIGDQLKEYSLAIKNLNSEIWIPVGVPSFNAITNDLLATLNLRSLQKNQLYILKLSAVTLLGQTWEDKIMFYYADNRNNPPRVKIEPCFPLAGCSNYYLYLYGIDQEEGFINNALFRIDQGPWRFVEYSRLFLPSLNLVEGNQYTLEVKVVDSTGLESIKKSVLNYTKYPPQIKVENWYYYKTTKLARFRLKMHGSRDIFYEFVKYSYRLDGGQWSVLSSKWPNLEIANVVSGNHVIDIKAVSWEGLESEVMTKKFRVPNQ